MRDTCEQTGLMTFVRLPSKGIFETGFECRFKIKKKGAGDLQHKILSYWWEQTGDIDMILTFVAENGMVTLDRYSTFRGFDGNRGVGLCQMYETWHSDFIYKNGRKSEGFSDEMMNWKTQADRCIGIWQDVKARKRLQQTFHAYSTRERARKVLIFNF